MKNRIRILFENRRDNIRYAQAMDRMYGINTYYRARKAMYPMPNITAKISIFLFGDVIKLDSVKYQFMEYKDSKWQ